MSELQRRRIAANLAQTEVAYVLGRSQAWYGMVERGTIVVSEETKEKILRTISRLAAHREAMRREREEIAQASRLPRVCV